MARPGQKRGLRLLVVDDHAVLVDVMRRLLENDDAFSLVSTAGDIESAYAAVRAHRPDVVLLDVNMGAESGLDAIVPIRQLCPKARIIMLSMCLEPMFRDRSFELGADAYVAKGARFETLRSVILHRPGDPAAGALDQAWLRASDGPTCRGTLSARELQVVHAVASGRREKEVAAELNIAISSVGTYLRRVMAGGVVA